MMTSARWFFAGVYRFQQDNEPKPKAKIVKEYLESNIIKKLDWQIQSPDFNPFFGTD